MNRQSELYIIYICYTQNAYFSFWKIVIFEFNNNKKSTIKLNSDKNYTTFTYRAKLKDKNKIILFIVLFYDQVKKISTIDQEHMQGLLLFLLVLRFSCGKKFWDLVGLVAYWVSSNFHSSFSPISSSCWGL